MGKLALLPLLVFIVATGFIENSLCQDAVANRRPVFVKDTDQKLRFGVNENTPEGTILLQLRCEDADGDPIIYEKVSGVAVGVYLNGTVYLSQQLDRDEEDVLSFDIVFRCFDVDNATGGAKSDGSTLEAFLTIDDYNDNAPTFRVGENRTFSSVISENAPVGTLLEPLISVIDRDILANARIDKIYFACDSPNATVRNSQPDISKAVCDSFFLNSSSQSEGRYTAFIYLKNPLDYETRSEYQTQIIATDVGVLNNSLTGTVNYQIQILDAQDNDPIFTNLGSTTSMVENTQTNTFLDFSITAQDGDTGESRPVKIELISDEKNAFYLGQSERLATKDYGAKLFVNNSLDREEVGPSYSFVVKVTELDNGVETSATATATYSIKILDINDEAPTFEDENYVVNFAELPSTATVPVQIPRLTIRVADRDDFANSRYKVTIVNQTYADVFSISPGNNFVGSASIYLAVNELTFMDYDVPEYRKQIVEIEAKETNTASPRSSSATVTVLLTDVNDNSPSFMVDEYRSPLSENQPTIPTVVLTLEATDIDSGDNGEIEYFLENQENAEFSLDPKSGELFLRSSLDYELTEQYAFLAFARDNGTDRRSTQITIIINVQNYNDLAPVFVQDSYQTSVNEDSLEFFTPVNIKANDREVGTVRVTYRLVSGQSPNNAFSLDPDSGQLTLVAPLRFEDSNPLSNGEPSGRFRLVVEASDNTSPDPPQTSRVNVTVTINDVNNFSPVLDPNEYYANLSEAARPGTYVADVNGTDEDSGLFGTLTYRIASGGFDNFVIDPTTGVVTVNNPQQFDYDIRKSYEVLIRATDGGLPRKSDTATIFVDIFDANNKPPRFDSDFYVETVDEDEDINFVILTVFAKDPDQKNDLRYRIVEDTIEARDGDGNTVTSTFRYDFRNALGIDEVSGDIFIKNELNRQEALDIGFEVEVEDINAVTANQTHRTQVLVTVTGRIDDNIIIQDNNPYFMNEDVDTNFDVITLVATDPLRPLDNLRFFKQSGSNYFVITESGIVRPARSVDYEEDPRLHRVVARVETLDGSRSATTTLSINILDINDNKPEFDQTRYTASVDEDATYPKVVTSVRATDRDSSSFGPVEYRIGGGQGSADFQLFESLRGGVDVRVAQGVTLNFNAQSRYELEIIANDKPNPDIPGDQNFNSVPLIISVNDKNNNFPIFVFENDTRRLAVSETAPEQQAVGTVVATDNDFGINGEVSYFLEEFPGAADSATGLSLFRIIRNLGTIVVAGDLIGYGGRTFTLQVRASDGGVPRNSAYLTVQIAVLRTQIDDGSPEWIRPSEDISVDIYENMPNAVVIPSYYFNVLPRTGDTITFSLSPLTTYDDAFVINSTTGEITAVRALDREIRDSYTLIVNAEDNVTPEIIRSSRQIIVNILDVNDNDASFQNPMDYTQCGEPITDLVVVYINENIPANEPVYQVQACDPDGPGSNEIIYQLYTDNFYCVQKNLTSAIQIESDGRLTSRIPIDHEEYEDYVVCVEAVSVNPVTKRKKRAIDESQLDYSIDNVIYIHFIVNDLNDNGPVFPKDSIIAVMNIRPSILDTVVWLDAVDADSSEFNSITYTITSVVFHDLDQSRRVNDLFAVKSRLAISPLRTNYDRFARGYFEMEVLATDSLQPSFQDTQTIFIYLYRPSQAIKLTLDYPPSDGYQLVDPLTNELNEAVSGYQYVFLQASEHSSGSGVDVTKTDVCFLGIDTSLNRLLDKPDFINAIEDSRYADIFNKAEYSVLDRGACYPSRSSEETIRWRNLWWVLVAIAIFIFVCCLIFIILVSILYKRYKRYMKSKQMYLVPQ